MAITPLNFGIQSNPGRFGSDGTGRLINCYAEARGNEGKGPFGVYSVPGYTLFGTVAGITQNGTRGLLTVGNALYWVVGKQLRKVDVAGTSTLIGGIADVGRVSMARNSANPAQIGIVTQGGLRFILETATDELSSIDDTDLPPPVWIEEIGGYFLFLLPSGEVFYSEINQGSNIGGLNFFEAEARADGGKAILRVRDVIWVFGERTVQPFQQRGAADNPFLPLLGSTVERGCLAGGSVKLFDNSAIFAADDRTVRRLNGSVPQKISTHYVDDLLRKETKPESLTGDVISIQGHEFYQLSGTAFTVIYDAATNLWHERASKGLARSRIQGIVNFADKWIAGDYVNGNLYELDPDVYAENGDDLTLRIISPIAHTSPARLKYNKLWLDFETGRGLNDSNGDDQDPQVSLSVSDDAGRTYGNARKRSLGKIGEYGVRAKFNALGTEKFKGRVFKLEVSAQAAKAFIGAYGDVRAVRA